MNVYNSTAGLIQDDTDMTMINYSFIYDGNDEPISSCIPIVRRLQQANQSKSIPNHDLLEIDGQIEQMLSFYRRDLRQESNTELDCHRQLITRLVDSLRPIYSSNEKQMRDLDGLYKEIFDLQEARSNEQKEKIEQLTNEVVHLKRMMMTPSIEDDQMSTRISGKKSLDASIDYEQWREMEEETQQLHHLVQTQQKQIDELLELVSPTEIVVEEKENLIQEIPDETRKKCSISSDEIQITEHADTHVIEELECPYCNEKLSNTDDIGYIAHLSQCFNDMTGGF